MTASRFLPDDRMATIDTPLGKDVFLVRSFHGEEGLSRLFRLEVELLSERDDVDLDALIGRGVTLSVRGADGRSRPFHGIVSRCSRAGADERFVTYHLEMVPWLWLLSQTIDCRVFQEQSVPEIVAQLFEELSLTDFEWRLSGSYAPRTYCVQYGETTLDFVSRLLEEEGIFYFFEHEADRHRLVLADAGTAHPDCPGVATVRYTVSPDKLTTEDEVFEWRSERRLRTGAVARTSYDFESPRTDREGLSKSSEPVGGSDRLEAYEYLGETRKKLADNERAAELEVEALEADGELAEGRSHVWALRAGHRFELSGHYSKSVDGVPHVLTSVDHRFHQPIGVETPHATIYENAFRAAPHSVTRRPARRTPKPRIHGPQTAVVVGPPGEEIHVDKHGRIKVQFHWDRLGKDDDSSSCWMRVSQAWAGKGWGTLFLPRVGQEVIVGFLDGDPDQPMILGSVYNAAQTPPYSLPAEKTRSGIKTHSSKGGGGFNELRFEDEKGQEQVFLRAERDLEVLVQNDRTEKVEKNHDEQIGGDRSLAITGNETKEVEGDQQLEVGGQVQEKITGDHQEKCSASYTLEASTSIKLQCGGSCIELTPGGIQIRSAGPVEIEGALAKIAAAALNVDAGVTKLSGSLLVAAALLSASVTTSNVTSPTYTPGIGNLI